MITREGWILIQDDPLTHAVPVVLVDVAGRVCRFFYMGTVTEQDAHGRRVVVSSYVEEEPEEEGGGNGADPLEAE